MRQNSPPPHKRPERLQKLAYNLPDDRSRPVPHLWPCPNPMNAAIDLNIERKTFASGVLPDLIAVLRRSVPGDLVAVIGNDQNVGPDLEAWCRFTGNPLLEATVQNGRWRWV